MFPLFSFLYYASGYTCIFYVLLKHYRFFFLLYPFSICIWKFCCSWGRSEWEIGCWNDTKKKYNEAEKKIVLDKTSYKKKQSRDVFFLFMWISRNRKVYCLLGENKRFFFFFLKSLKAISKIYMLRKLLRNWSVYFVCKLFKLFEGFFLYNFFQILVMRI